jgi:hypothetical protein
VLRERKMSWTQTDLTFKKLFNKRVTSSTKRIYEEIGDYTLNIHADEIWAEAIPSTPPGSTTAVVEVRTLLTLTQDTTVAGLQAWYAADGMGNRLKDWIPDKFDTSPSATYAVKLFDQDDNQIPATDPSNWLFDYQTGILILQNTHASATGFKITGYRYVGTKGVAGAAGVIDGTGTANNIPIWTDADTLSDSIISQTGTSVITINGVLRATSKSFDIPHPIKEGYRLVYGCLEGPENGVYHRGKVSGKGDVYVELPDYWSELVEDYTINLTAYGNYSIFVSSQSQKGFYVRRCGTFLNRSKTIEFSYEVIGNRTDAPLITEYKIR